MRDGKNTNELPISWEKVLISPKRWSMVCRDSVIGGKVYISGSLLWIVLDYD